MKRKPTPSQLILKGNRGGVQHVGKAISQQIVMLRLNCEGER